MNKFLELIKKLTKERDMYKSEKSKSEEELKILEYDLIANNRSRSNSELKLKYLLEQLDKIKNKKTLIKGIRSKVIKDGIKVSLAVLVIFGIAHLAGMIPGAQDMFISMMVAEAFVVMNEANNYFKRTKPYRKLAKDREKIELEAEKEEQEIERLDELINGFDDKMKMLRKEIRINKKLVELFDLKIAEVDKAFLEALKDTRVVSSIDRIYETEAKDFNLVLEKTN